MSRTAVIAWLAILALSPSPALAARSPPASVAPALADMNSPYARLLGAMLPADDPAEVRDSVVRVLIAGLVRDSDTLGALARTKPEFLPTLKQEIGPVIAQMIARQDAALRIQELTILRSGLTPGEADAANRFYASDTGRRLVAARVKSDGSGHSTLDLSSEDMRSLTAFAGTAVGEKMATVLEQIVAARQKTLAEPPNDAEKEAMTAVLLRVVARYQDPPGTVAT